MKIISPLVLAAFLYLGAKEWSHWSRVCEHIQIWQITEHDHRLFDTLYKARLNDGRVIYTQSPMIGQSLYCSYRNTQARNSNAQ